MIQLDISSNFWINQENRPTREVAVFLDPWPSRGRGLPAVTR